MNSPKLLNTSELENRALAMADLWFRARAWRMFDFQKDCLVSYFRGQNGILNAPTGTGKTFALAIPFLLEAILKSNKKSGLKVLWVTPLRALSVDICHAIEEAAIELQIDWKIERRSGDVSASKKKAQLVNPPDCLITTPESIHILFASKGYQTFFKNIQLVVVDEWHELLSSKRGVQVELALSRLKNISADLRIWGISATIGNIEQAAQVLLGEDQREETFQIIRSEIQKKLKIKTILPKAVDEYPWAGHLGIPLLNKTLPIIEKNKSTILFTNTRSQAEIWYQRILEEAPELAGRIALHHGSLDKELREWVEKALHDGRLKAVVSTSSLDLGVDFRPESSVIQIGSPKGIARFIQRAGRSGHTPYETSKVYFLPTNSLEIIEASALQTAVANGHVESRIPVIRAFDVLVQYLITLAVSDGLYPEEIYREIVKTNAYSSVTEEEWNWLIRFVSVGGNSLQAYDEFRRMEWQDGRLKVNNRRISMRHRLSMGTIVSEISMNIKLQNGKKLGTIEEYFISRLRTGDVFAFAGQTYELVRTKGFNAFVKAAKAKRALVPSWTGGRISLSSEISEVLREELVSMLEKPTKNVETKKLQPLFKIQQHLSLIPKTDEFLIETYHDQEGHHLFFYPFEGRMVHEGIALIIAYRISKLVPITISMAMNDYGFELLSDQEIPIEDALEFDLFSSSDLISDIGNSSNMSEMAQRRFRDIAAISGLTFKGYPGRLVKERHLQSSSALFFNVFNDYEPDNLLLQQAFEEVLYNQLEAERIKRVFKRFNKQSIILKEITQPSPFSFPIMVDRLRDRLSNEGIEERLRKMLGQSEST